VESSYGAPVATGKYVWIANPTSGRVAYIDASTLEIKLVDAGHGPTFVAAVPDPKDDVALVLNVLSRDATLLRASASGLDARSFPVPSSCNAWAVSADGRWAIAWTDARRVKEPDPVEGYQDITVLHLAPGAETSTELTVGYRPVAVAFDTAAANAYAVTQDGISVISLADDAPVVTKNVALSSTPGTPVETNDVAITPDGALALVRREGQSSIGVHALGDGSQVDVVLPGPATDLDLAPDGKTAVAVIRSTGQIALLPVPGIAADPATFALVDAGALVGSASLAPASPVAFFYTNATPSKDLVVIDTEAAPPSPRTILMRAPIEAVFPTPDAAHALVLHGALEDAGSHYPSALSLAPIALDLPPKIVGLEAPPIAIAVAPAGDHALVATGDAMGKVFQLVLASMPSLKVTKLPLASLPIAAGIVAGANRGFVAQEHPDGRITFVDLASGEARTLTGFELATQVVDGTK
jgi:DNA-binding beta-propeller fold protein YncE